jgi:hypothetical protein
VRGREPECALYYRAQARLAEVEAVI